MPFSPRLQILPASQRLLWDELNQVPEEFTLYGGTALALRLGHRASVDFDFFGANDFDPLLFAERVLFLKNARIVQRAPNTLTAIVARGADVKVSFFGLPHLKKVLEPDIAPGNALKIASLLDLAGTKASVVQARAEAKDYLDIAALIEAGVDLAQALSAAKLIYADSFNPQITLKALSYFDEGNRGGCPSCGLVRIPGCLTRRAGALHGLRHDVRDARGHAHAASLRL
jgi:hypothetical protein